MNLTAAVHSYTQHGCFIIAFDIFVFQRVGQEDQVCYDDAMRLLNIIQLLHKKGLKKSELPSQSRDL